VRRNGTGAGGLRICASLQEALRDHGIPLTSLGCDDMQAEYERLTALDVKFTAPPQKYEGFAMAIFDDGGGNLTMLHEG